jgi:hypothetical protein
MTIYWATPVSWTTAQGRPRSDGTTGTPHIKITFALTHRREEHETEWTDIQPGELAVANVDIYLSDRCLGTPDNPGIARRQLDALGFNGDFGDIQFTTDGVELIARTEMWNGKPRTRWELFNLTSGVEPFTRELVLEMNARYKAIQRADRQRQPSPSKTTAPKAEAGAGMPAPRRKPQANQEDQSVPFDQQ